MIEKFLSLEEGHRYFFLWMIIHRFLSLYIDRYVTLQIASRQQFFDTVKKKSKKKWIIKDFVSRFNPLLISYYIREIIYPLKRRINFIKH